MVDAYGRPPILLALQGARKGDEASRGGCVTALLERGADAAEVDRLFAYSLKVGDFAESNGEPRP